MFVFVISPVTSQLNHRKNSMKSYPQWIPEKAVVAGVVSYPHSPRQKHALILIVQRVQHSHCSSTCIECFSLTFFFFFCILHWMGKHVKILLELNTLAHTQYAPSVDFTLV